MKTAERQVLPETRTGKPVRCSHHANPLEEVESFGSNTYNRFALTNETGHQVDGDFQRMVREEQARQNEWCARQEESLALLHEKIDQLLGQRNQKLEPWMTTREAADYLRMTPRGVRVAAEKGRLPGCHRGKTWVFKKADIDRVIKKQKQTLSEETQSIWR